MPLDASVTESLSRIEEWRGFPKYALERRLDIFLTPYLTSYVGALSRRKAITPHVT